MKRVLLAAAAYNWAETHRMATIGQAFKKQGWKVYTLGEGKYETLLEEDLERVKINADTQWYTDERIYKLMHMDDFGNDYCNEEELETIIQEEVEILKKLQPQVVITGYRTTFQFFSRSLFPPQKIRWAGVWWARRRTNSKTPGARTLL